MELSANIEFITKYETDGQEYYIFWVQFGDSGRMVTMTEDDLEDDP